MHQYLIKRQQNINQSKGLTQPTLQIKNDTAGASKYFYTNTDHVAQLQQMGNNSSQIQKIAQLQQKANSSTNPIPIQQKKNTNGLPDNLKTGIENLSGHSMDDVNVHYNSNKPTQLQAHAYAQGTDIHIATGQEKHLPHEAWHVVQQKQGRVKPTLQLKGIAINDDSALEREATIMGQKALNTNLGTASIQRKSLATTSNPVIVQRQVFKVRKGTNKDKYYTDYDESRLFDTKIEAEAYQKSILRARAEEKAEIAAKKKEARLKKRRQELDERFPDYKAPETGTARLFKNQDKDFDDIPVTRMGPENAKKFMEMQIARRRAGLFTTQVINLGGLHHVMDPGPDIGLTTCTTTS